MTRSTRAVGQPGQHLARSAPVTRLVSSATRSGRSPNRLPGVGHRRRRRAAPAPPVRAARPAPRSAPSARPGGRPAPRPAAPRRRPPSCRRRRRPAAAGASGGAPARSASISAIARSARPSAGTAAPRGTAARARRRPTWRMPAASCSSRRLRRTSTSCTRSSSSKARRRRAFSFSAHRLGRVDGEERPPPVDQRRARRRTAAGSGSAMPRAAAALRRASSTTPAISQVCSWPPSRSAGRWARCGRSGRRSGRRPGSSSAARPGRRRPCRTGRPGGSGRSWRSRHGWLKNTTLSRPEPSPTVAVTIDRRLRVCRFATDRTVTSTRASWPGHEVADPGLAGPVDPAPGVEGHEVERRCPRRARQRLARLVPDALQPPDAGWASDAQGSGCVRAAAIGVTIRRAGRRPHGVGSARP